jgi:hypothetical protein
MKWPTALPKAGVEAKPQRLILLPLFLLLRSLTAIPFPQSIARNHRHLGISRQQSADSANQNDSASCRQR